MMSSGNMGKTGGNGTRECLNEGDEAGWVETLFEFDTRQVLEAGLELGRWNSFKAVSASERISVTEVSDGHCEG